MGAKTRSGGHIFCPFLFLVIRSSFCEQAFTPPVFLSYASFCTELSTTLKSHRTGGKYRFYKKIHGFTKYEEPVNFNDYLDFKTDVLFSDSAAFIHSKKPFDFSCSQIYPQKDKLST